MVGPLSCCRSTTVELPVPEPKHDDAGEPDRNGPVYKWSSRRSLAEQRMDQFAERNDVAAEMRAISETR